MAVKIRLKRTGRKKNPFYHFVAADSHSPRDGRFIEKLGTYNPKTKEVQVNQEKIAGWQKNGAQTSEVVERLLKLVAKK